MVQDVLGSTGRFLVEVGLIGFLLGTCVAYFIMIGDLAPKIVTEFTNIKYDQNLRAITVMMLSIFVALPLSLLKKVDSLTSLSVLSMILYCCLILKLMFETTDKYDRLDKLTQDKLDKISYWNMSGLLTTFPIFSMAMSCQTSLFEIFDSSVINNDLETIKRDNSIIKKAIYLCSFVYIIVGLLGSMAFHEQILYGNILLAFRPSLTTTLTKFVFIISLLLSFPLCLFPCRTSVYSLTFGKIRKSVNFQALSSNHAASASTLVGVSSDITNGSQADQTPRKDANCDSIIFKNSDSNNNNNNNNSQHVGNVTNGMRSNNQTLFIDQRPNNRTGNHYRLQPLTNNGSSSNYTKLLSDDYDDYEDDANLDGEDDDAMLGHSENGNSHHHPSSHISYPTRLYMSDFHFKFTTVVLIIVTVILSLLFPHIEFILGIVGSTAGTTVCFVLPAYTFIRLGDHTRTELYLARLLLMIGLAMLIFCTYSTIHNANLTQEEIKVPNTKILEVP